MQYDLMVLTLSTVDSILKIEGRFPIEGGCTRRVLGCGLEPGGEGNLMIVFSRMGGRVLPVGPLGDDHYGAFLRQSYSEQGIDVSRLRTVRGYRSPVANCVVDEAGVHSFLSTITSCDFGSASLFLEQFETCRALFLSGYYMTDRADPYCEISRLLALRAKERSAPLFFDPGPLAASILPDMLETVLSCATVIALNDEEAALLTGEHDPALAGCLLSERTDALLLVKAGSKGCYAVGRNVPGRRYPAFPVRMVDTMGAGDSFLGAFAYAWLQDWELETCVTFANASGAVKASKFGTGTKVPTFDEMLAILEQNGYTVPEICRKTRRFTGLRLHKPTDREQTEHGK